MIFYCSICKVSNFFNINTIIILYGLNKDIPLTQRALVLQGGGALGAYQVGALKVLFSKIVKESNINEDKDNPLFDVIAGSSIGAMNAAVIVSNIINNKKTWRQSLEVLERMWTDEVNGLSSTPDFGRWWWPKKEDSTHPTSHGISATKEARIKYYSVKEYLKHGIPNVSMPKTPKYDFKFGDPENIWFVNSIDPLQYTLEKYSKNNKDEKLRIFTSWKKREPRLLVIAVDVAAGNTAIFDSYHKQSDYKNDTAIYDGNGITIDHIMASGTIPLIYEFRKVGKRMFCDGGLLNNTPFRELLQAHRDYWTKEIGNDENKIPDLEVYIINLHPVRLKAKDIPNDYDGLKDLINDITYSDRNSHYDESVTDIINDYADLVYELKEIAYNFLKEEDERKAFKEKFDDLLKNKVKSITGSNLHKTYYDILKDRFKITKVVRIEPDRYDDSIYGKGVDFTSKTIRTLIDKGKKDAEEILKHHELQSETHK